MDDHSDAQLICAAQSGGNPQANDEVMTRFGAKLRIMAGRARKLHHLDSSATDDIVQRAMVSFFTPRLARFDPERCGEPEAYLRGLIQNAACSQARFAQSGGRVRHKYLNPENARRRLPSDAEEVVDTRDQWSLVEASDTAVAVMAMATAEERGLALAVFYWGDGEETVAARLGVHRTTVTRRLARLFSRYREQCPN